MFQPLNRTQQCRVYPAFNVSPSSLRACYFLRILFSQSGRVACFFLCDARAVECRRTSRSALPGAQWTSMREQGYIII